MRSRIVLILIALTGLWSLMVARAAWLQLLPDSRLQSLKKRQFETVVTLNPRRGDVIDRNGHELAVSMTSYSLFADPKILEEPKKVVRFLASELKLPVKSVEERIMKNRQKRFVWIERHVEQTAYEAISAKKIRGIGFVEESKRIYPNEKLLSHVLGFVGGEEQGLEGLELRYNDQLRAAKKHVSIQRDARGRPLIVNGQIFNQVPDGADLQLTIDRELQFILEQELSQTVVRHEADSAVGVVLDAQTSEVLAMASSPSFDPNKSSNFAPELRRNRAVTDSYEPGSTMKTFVIAGAINKGLVEPNTKFDVSGGQIRLGKRVIHEADAHHVFDSLSISEILAVSSNVGMAKLALKIGPEAIRETLENFGFGVRTGIDLPGEAKGILQKLPWRDHLMANISFGHGIAATAIQVANAYAVIANGGWLRQPYAVKSIRDHENGETIEMKPKTLRRVLSDEAVAKMRLILTGVTSKEGTGYNARVAGFPVAGKTGTAQKVMPNGKGYMKGGYISSFAGFLPANNPKFVIYVVVDHPRKEYYGSAVAAPVFSRVASFAVRKAGIAPVLISEENILPQVNGSNVSGSNVATDLDMVDDSEPGVALAEGPEMPSAGAAAWTAIRNKVRSVTGVGTRPATGNDAVVGARPILGVSKGEEVNVKNALAKTGEERRAELESASAPAARIETSSPLPDLTGLTLREVLARLHGSGIQVNVRGQGFVSQTIPAAGAYLSADSKNLTVILSRTRE
jgi:cell division protein FtsI (penicillin-binding protein 3)